ncbi:hypothetical protein RN001_002473 [Aquatica leii]|uniref:Copper transport protein ATOX1 n=1 Tax=Aquatica leii TaxID=1421715 RepID=A0AAN7SK63_9COLE|nr:hypothetical protein RN001_002473 [Aquatica leii]
MSEAQVHEYNVKMTCDGCSGAVQRVLSKFEGKGIDKIDINLVEQIVKVTSTLSPDEILKMIQKTGKEVKYVKTY